MRWLNCISMCMLSLILGCSSTPKTDDYAKNIVLEHPLYQTANSVEFYINPEMPIDVRGEYSANDSVGSGAILYQGGAGALGFLAQIATHAAINSSVRNGKLSEEQIKANEILMPFNATIEKLKLSELYESKEHDFQIVSQITDVNQTSVINVHPIFFVAQNFEYISVKNIVWIDKEDGSKKNKKHKANVRYQNLVEVFSKRYTTEEREQFKSENAASILEADFRAVFNESLEVAARDVIGKYLNDHSESKSFKLVKDTSSRYIRGQRVDTLCGKMVLKNLRSWLVVIPMLPESNDSVVNGERLCSHPHIEEITSS